MRAVIQRACGAKVSVNDQVVGEFSGPGLVILLGVTHEDPPPDAQTLAHPIAHLRIMAEERSLLDVGGSALAISQFTLYANTSKGRRPSWNGAAPGPIAEPLFDHFCMELSRLGVPVQTGVFGADMQVTLTNDGPVTLILESSTP